MTDASFTTGRCAACGEPLSHDLGITNYGSEGDSKLYCTPCAPNQGRGYTLEDLQQMREDVQVARAAREVDLIDRLGPDLYFAITGRRPRPAP